MARCKNSCHPFRPDEFELAFDIDYMLEWIEPKGEGLPFHFWISPATLVFENVRDISFALQAEFAELEIDHIDRQHRKIIPSPESTRGRTGWKWSIQCQEGTIKFSATGFKQSIRSAPVLADYQIIPDEIRGPSSFFKGRVDV